MSALGEKAGDFPHLLSPHVDFEEEIFFTRTVEARGGFFFFFNFPKMCIFIYLFLGLKSDRGQVLKAGRRN